MKEHYGMFGTGEVERDENGFIELPCFIQESGMFAGRSPEELRISYLGSHDDDEFNKKFCAKLNRRTDLPYYLGKCLIKVLPGNIEVKDEDLEKEGLKPLPPDGFKFELSLQCIKDYLKHECWVDDIPSEKLSELMDLLNKDATLHNRLVEEFWYFMMNTFINSNARNMVEKGQINDNNI